MLGEKIGEMSGKINSQRVLSNVGGGPNGNLVSGKRIVAGHKRKGDGHVLDRCPSGRDTLRRRARGDDNQGRENGHVDRPRRRHDEERRERDLSRRYLLSNYAPAIVPAKQGRGTIRIRGGRRGRYTL